MQELNINEIEMVSGGATTVGAGLSLGATIVGIGIGVATGGILGVVTIGAAAIGGLVYAYDAATEIKRPPAPSRGTAAG